MHSGFAHTFSLPRTVLVVLPRHALLLFDLSVCQCMATAFCRGQMQIKQAYQLLSVETPAALPSLGCLRHLLASLLQHMESSLLTSLCPNSVKIMTFWLLYVPSNTVDDRLPVTCLAAYRQPTTSSCWHATAGDMIYLLRLLPL